ncbi:hypothetical protein [Streptomyces sp. NPDC059092]|uniref:hypothetical protein n=1 Tax=Streptomyces sp. NPDC059092 TaxID=3346725 RepID=UPI00367B8A0B
MIRSDGRAKGVDFGITKGSEGRYDVTTTGVLIDAPACTAPDCFGGTFDHRADLYSLGRVLYEMAAGPSTERPGTWSTSTSMSGPLRCA